ncbi:Serine/Threonine protein kinase, partial [Reticulomyxa filosa]
MINFSFEKKLVNTLVILIQSSNLQKSNQIRKKKTKSTNLVYFEFQHQDYCVWLLCVLLKYAVFFKLITKEKKVQKHFFILHHPKEVEKMNLSLSMKVAIKFFSFKNQPVFRFLFLFIVLKQSKEEETQIIIQHWIRILNIKLGWINDFDKLVVNYVSTIFMFDAFHSSSKLLNTFTGHMAYVNSVDFSTFDCSQVICSGSSDKTVCVWDVDNNKQIQSFNGHSSY